MKIAAAYENGQICQHFGKTKQFKIYQIENDRIAEMQIIDVSGEEGHEIRTALLKELGIGILVCGKIGMPAQMELMSYGIAPFPGAFGDADMQVGALFINMLESEKKVREENCQSSEEHSCESCAHREQCEDYNAKKNG